MMTVERQIEAFEGRSCKAYPDPLTGGAPWTIGVGHCGPDVKCHTAWTNDQIDAAFCADVADARRACASRWEWFDALNEPRKAVLIGMAFQLGMRGLLGFSRMLDAVRDQRYMTAAEEMRQSKWAKQTPRRTMCLALQMESGEWEAP
jgi:lysozyme